MWQRSARRGLSSCSPPTAPCGSAWLRAFPLIPCTQGSKGVISASSVLSQLSRCTVRPSSLSTIRSSTSTRTRAFLSANASIAVINGLRPTARSIVVRASVSHTANISSWHLIFHFSHRSNNKLACAHIQQAPHPRVNNQLCLKARN